MIRQLHPNDTTAFSFPCLRVQYGSPKTKTGRGMETRLHAEAVFLQLGQGSLGLPGLSGNAFRGGHPSGGGHSGTVSDGFRALQANLGLAAGLEDGASRRPLRCFRLNEPPARQPLDFWFRQDKHHETPLCSAKLRGFSLSFVPSGGRGR